MDSDNIREHLKEKLANDDELLIFTTEGGFFALNFDDAHRLLGVLVDFFGSSEHFRVKLLMSSLDGKQQKD